MEGDAVFVGCYERFVFKYIVSSVPEKKGSQSEATESVQHRHPFRAAASHAAHTGAVKCIALGGSAVFSGGFGDIIRVYHAESGRDEDSMTVPDAGAISCLAAFSQSTDGTASLLLNGCTDGSMHIWKRKGRSWLHHKRLPFHKAAVNAVDIHSTGRMAFTVARDRGLVLWDLIHLKRAFSCRLSTEASHVAFHPYQSEFYTLCYQNTVARLRTDDGASFDCWKQMADVQGMRFWKRRHFLTIADDGAVRLWDERCREMSMELADAHCSRIKGIDVLNSHHFITGASDGEMKIWDVRKTKKSLKCVSLASVETEARITCLVCVPCRNLHDGSSAKRKRSDIQA